MTDLSYPLGDVFFDLLYRLVGRETINKIFAELIAKNRGATDLTESVRKYGGAAIEPLVDDFVYTTRWTERVERAKDIHELLAMYKR